MITKDLSASADRVRDIKSTTSNELQLRQLYDMVETLNHDKSRRSSIRSFPDVLLEENRELVDHYGQMDDLRKERVRIGCET